jgi:phosphopantetheinyl transferase
MEDLPKIKSRMRLPLSIPVADYLRDHVFRGEAVLPAVEAMNILAESSLPYLEEGAAVNIASAEFNRFLYIGPDAECIEAINELEFFDQGSVTSKLITMKKSANTGITRPVKHVSLSFTAHDVSPIEPPLDYTLGLEGIGITLDKIRVYDELIPFKTAYHTIEEVFVSEHGAVAIVSGGSDRAPAVPLGSPFPLDASFHAACVWGQRFAGMVGFPVHIDRRTIFRKTKPGETYTCRIIPVKTGAGRLIFDLWIYSRKSELCEEVRGLHMHDVSKKTLMPPQWIRSGDDRRLDPVRAACREFSIIELAAVTGQCEKAMSSSERERFGRMSEKRGKSYLAARLALKKISRRLSGHDMDTPASAITTVKPDGLPACPLTNGDEIFRCTASHDSRFAVAAASEHKIGIDVEELSERVLKSRHFYMHEDELSLVKSNALGEVGASARVWTIKEAVSKASGMHLADAWLRTKVTEIGTEKSLVLIDDDTHKAIHAVVDGHIFTLLTM